jgi:membrane protein YdbS with pleckstrin-like domain
MLTLRPVFIGWIVLLYQLPFQLFFTFWSAMFFGGMLSSFHVFPKDSLAPFVCFGALAFCAVPLVIYFGKKLNYARTEYKFSNDRLEFEEGFFTINEKIVRYRDVREVTLRKGFFQRMYDLGSIYLATEATGSSTRPNIFSGFGFGNVSASGIGVCDIRDPDQNFERIRSMVDAQAR